MKPRFSTWGPQSFPQSRSETRTSIHVSSLPVIGVYFETSRLARPGDKRGIPPVGGPFSQKGNADERIRMPEREPIRLSGPFRVRVKELVRIMAQRLAPLGMTIRAYAASRGKSATAVRKHIQSGKLGISWDGCVNPHQADIALCWQPLSPLSEQARLTKSSVEWRIADCVPQRDITAWRLYWLKRKSSLPWKQIAFELGISERWLKRIMAGQRISDKLWLRINDYLRREGYFRRFEQ